jgi:PhnB protein
MPVKAIPDGYHTVTPYLTVSDLPRLVKFVEEAFAGKASEMIPDANGVVRHAEVKIGDSMIMIGQENEKWKARPAALYLYVEDTHATYRRAIDAGGTSIMEPATQFYGDVNAGVEDPLGNWWWIATHVEDVPPEEMERRARENMK